MDLWVLSNSDNNDSKHLYIAYLLTEFQLYTLYNWQYNYTKPLTHCAPFLSQCASTLLQKYISLIINVSSKLWITETHSVQEYPKHLEMHIWYISCRKQTISEVEWSCISACKHSRVWTKAVSERKTKPSLCKSTEQLPKTLNPADSPPFCPLHNTQQEYALTSKCHIFLAHPASGSVAPGN